MTEQATTDAVRHTVTVPLNRERAFELFVDEFDSWWPRDSHHIADTPAAVALLEARDGGRWYERDEDGNECDWGRVLAFERPARIVLAWQLTPEFKFDPDPAKQTEVEVAFEPDGESATRVTVEHRGFDVHGEAGVEMRRSVGSEGGWATLLGLYEKAARS
jgi:uncharacterized protein YndB with AHSA1/START domain